MVRDGKGPYGKSVAIPLKELTWEDPETTEKALTFRLTIADYLMSTDGERCTSNPSEEAEGLARSCSGGRNAVSVRRHRTAPNAHRAFSGGFQISAR